MNEVRKEKLNKRMRLFYNYLKEARAKRKKKHQVAYYWRHKEDKGFMEERRVLNRKTWSKWYRNNKGKKGFMDKQRKRGREKYYRLYAKNK